LREAAWQGFHQPQSRRATWDLPESFQIDSLSLPDLVASKKTQRDKDRPMVRRLVEVSYDEGFSSPTPARIEFWLRELRTPGLLVDCVRWFREDAHRLANERVTVKVALAGDLDAIQERLAAEEARDGRSRTVLGLLPDQTATLVCADPAGKTRAVLGIPADGSSTLVFADRDGEPALAWEWMQPGSRV
jgi:hypothetical protein